MAKFIAVHSMPGNEQELISMLKQAAPQIPKGKGFKWVESYCDFTNHKQFCNWEAPSKEALEQAFKSNKVPFDAIYPVKRLNPATMKLE
jgi:hypothetical protein